MDIRPEKSVIGIVVANFDILQDHVVGNDE